MTTPERFVALGNQIYNVISPFAIWPKTPKLGLFSKGAVDSKGNLYVCQRADPPIIVVDRNGKFVRSIGDGREADSHGIWITRDDRVLLVDRDAHQLLCYAPDGKLLFILGDSKRPRFQAPFSHPTDVAVGLDGDIYVADGYGNSMVHRFSAEGTLKKSWGGFGIGPGEFKTPHGINVLSDGRILVGDRERDRLQIFDPDGSYLTEWHGFYHPMDIFVGRNGLIYVTDQCPGIISLNDKGEIVGSCKSPIAMPHGLTGDDEGNIYIIESPYVTKITYTEITKLVPVPPSI